MNEEPLFEIGADGVDAAQIVRTIQERVARKRAEGVYNDIRIAQAEKNNLDYLQNEEALADLYLETLRDAVYVDINDFAIHEQRRVGAPLLVCMKKTIWKLLKFYTYRLWSQQNQVNGLLLSAIENIEQRYRRKISDLEQKVAELEKKNG